MRSTDDFKDFRTLDESREKAQMTKKGAVVGGCYRNCKPSECAAAQDLLLQVEKREIAEMVMTVLNCKTIGVNYPMIQTIQGQLQGVEEVSKAYNSIAAMNAKETSVTLAWPKH